MAEYLAICAEDSDPNVFLSALDNVARAKRITKIAQDTGLSRESLYKTFRAGVKPWFETVEKILRALGVRFTVVQCAQLPNVWLFVH